MKALSVKQPWASLIASGAKTIELRTWRPTADEIVIASGQTFDRRGDRHPDGPRGVALCEVCVVGCREAHMGDALAAGLTGEQMASAIAEASGKGRTLYAWLLDSPCLVLPRAVKGQLGLFDL